MSRDYLTIGSSPCDESCAQVGSSNYEVRYRKEMTVFINQIRRECGPEVGSARLGIKGFPHDFGTYHEVVCYFDDTDVEGIEYAFKVERETPAQWDAQAREELS